jgi:hypothetical protein
MRGERNYIKKVLSFWFLVIECVSRGFVFGICDLFLGIRFGMAIFLGMGVMINYTIPQKVTSKKS